MTTSYHRHRQPLRQIVGIFSELRSREPLKDPADYDRDQGR